MWSPMFCEATDACTYNWYQAALAWVRGYSAARTLSLAAVLIATSNQWSLSLRDRNAACAAVDCHASSILRVGSAASWSRTYLCRDNNYYCTQRALQAFSFQNTFNDIPPHNQVHAWVEHSHTDSVRHSINRTGRPLPDRKPGVN